MPQDIMNVVPSLRVLVTDVRGNPLPDANVLVGRTDGASDDVGFDAATGSHRATKVATGTAVITVTHPLLEGQRRVVSLDQGPNEQLFLLGEPGGKTYFRETVRVPVDAEPDLVGVAVEPKARFDTKAVDEVAQTLGLAPLDVPELAARMGIRLYRAEGVEPADALRRLTAMDQVRHAGAVVSRRENGFTFLTNDVVVRFRGPRGDQVREIAKEHGFELVRELVYAPSAYVLRWGGPATLELLDAIEELAARDDVAWAEPNLATTPELDAITPNDALWAGAWDRQLVGVQDAWQHLQDAGLDTFGDPDVVLAVWDSGVQQSGGVPTNDDFAGTISNGQPKILTSFDFVNMVANNNTPWDDHGSGVAGVSVAKANNPSPVAGQGFGIAGAAPNVQMMCIAGDNTDDLWTSDQYIWMAGFDPVSPDPSFPAPLARGADVITCSLTPGAGAPLSGTAKATLDFLTTFGRGGKGTLCFFSTGNGNANNVTGRPWGAYEKSFGIAGTTMANDGTTEIRAPFSGWGQIAFCTPTHDQYPVLHNPPTGFATWGGAHAGQGNMISYRALNTTLSAASVVGATSLIVASAAGLAASQVIHVGTIGANGSEPAKITAVNAATNTLTVVGFMDGDNGFVGGLLNAHPAGTPVAQGPANHRNDFGGTSSATPLAAGVAALVLSARPSLTYIEVRQVLRDTALKLDLGNTDPTGQWLDANGDPSVTSGLPAVRSQWYGYGRLDAGAAVQTAISVVAQRDLILRDNLADTGSLPSSSPYWLTPDVWCRRTDPAMDPAALPASFAVAGPHEDPKRGQTNWIYARVHNRGTTASLDAWVRVSISHWPGMEFTWPTSFIPTNGPGDPIPVPMTPGTYLIGEAKVTGVAPGTEQIVSIEWPAGLIPPQTVMVGGSAVNWHPCLLAEITPHDGPLPTGNGIVDSNNLAQKNISIVDADAGSDFAFAFVVGNQLNASKSLVLEIDRGKLGRDVQLYVDLVDPILRRRIRQFAAENPFNPKGTPVPVRPPVLAGPGVLAPPRRLPSLVRVLGRTLAWKLGFHQGREVVLLDPVERVRLPILTEASRLQLLVLGGIVGPEAEPGEYEIVLTQRQSTGRITGQVGALVTIGKK